MLQLILAFLSISDRKLLDRFLRKQNLKFPVTITEVVFYAGFMNGQSLIHCAMSLVKQPVFDRFVSRLKFLSQ